MPSYDNTNRHHNKHDDDGTAGPIKRLPSLLSSPLFGTKVTNEHRQNREATPSQRANDDDVMELSHTHGAITTIAPSHEDLQRTMHDNSASHPSGAYENQAKHNSMMEKQSIPSSSSHTHTGDDSNRDDDHNKLVDDSGGGNTTTTDPAAGGVKKKQESQQLPLDSSHYEDILLQAVSWTEDLKELRIKIEDNRVRTLERCTSDGFGLSVGQKCKVFN